MIRLKGNLEFHSSTSQIRLFRKDGEAVCAIQGWPKPFSPRKLSQLNLPKGIKHEKVRITYNDRHLGYFQNGSFKLTGHFTGLRALFDYLR